MSVRRKWVSAFTLGGAVLAAGFALPGCGDDSNKTGTLVEKTPEQKDAQKASMEGMRKAMEGQGKAAAPTK
jgi:hypothetical protein